MDNKEKRKMLRFQAFLGVVQVRPLRGQEGANQRSLHHLTRVTKSYLSALPTEPAEPVHQERSKREVSKSTASSTTYLSTWNVLLILAVFSGSVRGRRRKKSERSSSYAFVLNCHNCMLYIHMVCTSYLLLIISR